jgi:hypothetical protein
MTIRPVGFELFHADGRTNMTKLFVLLETRLKRNVLSVLCGHLGGVYLLPSSAPHVADATSHVSRFSPRERTAVPLNCESVYVP